MIEKIKYWDYNLPQKLKNFPYRNKDKSFYNYKMIRM